MKFKPQISRRGKAYFAEIALARGPRQMAVTGSGSFEELFGYAWMAILERGERRLRLFQLQVSGEPWALGSDPTGAEWVEVPVPALPHDTKELRHLGLAFDQTARHVVAYERAGEVWVRQWDPAASAYAMRGPWPGVDPVLVMDATAGYYVPDSDVLLFHLAPDRRSLVMRAQRELFATGHTIESYADEAILDQGVSLPYQFELLGSFESDPNGTGLVLRSDLYPVRAEEALGVAALSAPASGVYWPVVVVRDLGAEDLGTAALSAPASGVYWPVVVVQDVGVDSLGATLAAPASGDYHAVVVVHDVGVDSVSAAVAAPAAGEYRLVVVVVDLTDAQYTSPADLGTAQLAAPTGGTYEAA